MHYKNGREAKNGDKVVFIPQSGLVDPKTGKVFTYGGVGILYDAVAGRHSWIGKIATISPNDPMPNLKECLHLDDVLDAIENADACKPPQDAAGG